MDLNEKRKKHYKFTIEFTEEEDRDEFKNYVHSVKTSTGTPIDKIAREMAALHKIANRKGK